MTATLTKPRIAAALDHELVIDNFAGGGGASLGIRNALGREVDYAINHDEAAVIMHRENHPGTVHLCESVWKVDPREVGRLIAGRIDIVATRAGHVLALELDAKSVRDKSRRKLAWLQADPDNIRIEYEVVTLKLADDTRYTPDFYVLRRDGSVRFWEAKGFWHDDALVKIKVAAQQFPEFEFRSARRVKGKWEFRKF